MLAILKPGTLWPAILRQTEHALRCGALRPIDTTRALIEQAGIRFVVRQVSSLTRKEATREAGGANRVKAEERNAVNPFLPYDPDLFVADLSDTHVALLNKFNVIDHHLLIVTRRFEAQETLLDLADFTALSACMAEFDGVGFYNGGAAAGASQRHKHLQMVPLLRGESGESGEPGADSEPPLPIESVLADARMAGSTGTLPALTFRHAFARLDLNPGASLPAPQTAFDCYRALLDALGLRAVEVDGELRQPAPYNLLVTRRWMLLVPRSAETTEGISVNALGFAGSLFVRDAAQLQTIEALGPMTVLQRVAVAVAGS